MPNTPEIIRTKWISIELVENVIAIVDYMHRQDLFECIDLIEMDDYNKRSMKLRAIESKAPWSNPI